MNIRMDHDRLQLFISFQHAGYEVIAGEHNFIVMHIIGDFPIMSRDRSFEWYSDLTGGR